MNVVVFSTALNKLKPMRQIILDTETTGLNPITGDRIIEIGCVEMLNRRITSRTFHTYLNPEREIDEGATAVHGLRWEDLLDKPKFAQIQEHFSEFVEGAELIIHNAPFDIGFLEAEYKLLGHANFQTLSGCTVVDTLRMAKQLHPGKRNSLDSLCERYGISNTHRTVHGALLDAQLLAEVYLALTRGQDSLSIGFESMEISQSEKIDLRTLSLPLFELDSVASTAHAAYLKTLETESKGNCVWRL